MKISHFFGNDYVDQASYDNLRKIASLVDGQKNAARKILYTVLEKNIKEKIKVSQLGSKVAEYAEYLHGNLDGVIVNLAQDFTGSNNIPLLQKKGNFGTRFSPEASASRYIYTYGTPEFFEFFKKDDIPILQHQSFEGQPIEPMFYVPSLPILLINGSEGVSSGFAQKVLPRGPKEIKKYLQNKLEGKKQRVNLTPFFNGFKGTIEQGDNSIQWVVKGVFERKGVNKVIITEVPIGYSLKSYLKVLDDLEEKKVIQSYNDKSEDDNFKFEVFIASKTLKEWDDDTILTRLKLVKRISENFTVVNESNKIQTFEKVEDILDKYIEVKLLYLQLRKNYMIHKLNEDIRFDFSKYLFIKEIVEDRLLINKRKKADVVKDIEPIKDILPKDGSYDYLLNMNIMSLTEERMEKLQQDIKDKKQSLDDLKATPIEQIWLGEI